MIKHLIESHENHVTLGKRRRQMLFENKYLSSSANRTRNHCVYMEIQVYVSQSYVCSECIV